MMMVSAADGHRKRHEQTTTGSDGDGRDERHGRGEAAHEHL